MPAITLSELEARVYRRIEENFLFYPKYQVDNAINEALQVLNLFTGYYQSTLTIGVTVATRFWYDVPNTMIFPMQVYVDRRMIFKASLSSTCTSIRDFLSANNLNDGGPLYWIPIGIRAFIVTPADTTGGRSLEIVGVVEPPVLTSSADVAKLSDSWLELVEDYAFYTLVLVEGGKIFADASKLFQKFQKQMRELQMWQTQINERYFVETESLK